MLVKHLEECPLHNKSYIGAYHDHYYLPSETGSVKCQTNQDVTEVPHSTRDSISLEVNSLHCATLLFRPSQACKSPAQD